jgi:hypothetical protein
LAQTAQAAYEFLEIMAFNVQTNTVAVTHNEICGIAWLFARCLVRALTTRQMSTTELLNGIGADNPPSQGWYQLLESREMKGLVDIRR